jgi:CHAD domain-containing protein
MSFAMPFHVKKSETPGRAVQRVCRERIGEARSRLRHGARPAAIHGARKEIKKLRALLQLVRGGIGRRVYRKGGKALRGAAKHLAPTRDARVMLKAFESLTGTRTNEYPLAAAALKKQARQQARNFRKEDAAIRAEKLLRKAGRHMDELKLKSSGWAAFDPGLEDCYRRGCAAFHLARREPQPEHFHAWRRHVKQLWYCLCLLQPAWTAATRRRVDALELLGEELGAEHDLHLLDAFVRKYDLVKEGTGLTALIAGQRRQLQAVALKLGARLYAQEPAAFCRRLQNEWNGWHGTASSSRRRE